MNKPTLLYIGNFELPDKDAASHRVMNNGKILRESYEVIFIGVSKNSNQKMRNDNVQGFDTWLIKYPNTIIEWVSRLLRIKYIRNIALRYSNVVGIIAYNYPAISLYHLRRYGKKNNIKIIADATEWYEDGRIIKKIDTKLRMEYIHKKLDGIICISSYLDNYYNKFLKTIVLPPLVDIKEQKWDNRLNVTENTKINFIYSGNPGSHKDKINIIIDALLNVKVEFKFNIAGITFDDYIKMYPNDVRKLEILHDKVEFLGKLEHSKSIELVKKSDFQIFLRENKRVNNAGFPTKLVESLTLGTPVITNNTSDIYKYIVTNENGILLNDINTYQIASIITNLISDRQLIRRIKINCINNNIFDYRNFSRDLLSFINIVLLNR